MRAEVVYRQLVLRDAGEGVRLPLAGPVNDLLGLAGADEEYRAYVFVRYKALVARRRGLLEEAGAQATEEERKQLQAAFLNAAKSATKGQLASEIAPYVERLRFLPGGEVDVPDFVALAAWSLLEAMRRQNLKLIKCPMCRRPWLGSPNGPKYCQRPAPPEQSRDCRTLAKEKRLAGDTRWRAYRREYKRLDEAKRRGTIDALELLAWREENGPATWQRFDEWKQSRKEEA